MKTTVELDDKLLRDAKKRAIDEGISLRALLEDALRERLTRVSPGNHPLANWGGPGNSDRDVLYEETYQQILEDIEDAMRRFEERKSDNDRA